MYFDVFISNQNEFLFSVCLNPKILLFFSEGESTQAQEDDTKKNETQDVKE